MIGGGRMDGGTIGRGEGSGWRRVGGEGVDGG